MRQIQDSGLKVIEHANQLYIDGKYKEAFHIVRELKNLKDYSLERQLKFQILKAKVLSTQGYLKESLKIAEKTYSKSRDQEDPTIAFDALLIKVLLLFWFMRYNELHDEISRIKFLYESFENLSDKERAQRRAECISSQGLGFWAKGDTKQAIKKFKKALVEFKRLGNKNRIFSCLINLGIINSHLIGDFKTALEFFDQCVELGFNNDPGLIKTQGEVFLFQGNLNLALNYFEKSLKESEDLDYDFLKMWIFLNMGLVYRLKGDFSTATKYLEKSLPISNVYSTFVKSRVLYNLFCISLEINSSEQIHKCLSDLEELANLPQAIWGSIFIDLYQICEAKLLLSNKNTRDRAKAEVLLKQVIEKNSYFEFTTAALAELCNLLILEFSLSRNVEDIKEIEIYTKKLLKIAEYSNSHSVLAETYLLQANLALIQIDLDGAKSLLTRAQNIAEVNDLNLLAQKISSEHDILLEKIDEWEKFNDGDTPMAKRIELASFDGVLNRLQGKRVAEPTELVDEESILLLIMDNSGTTYFSYIFMTTWDHGDLFSSFMSAFNTFSDEIFSKPIDRIRIGENTILINPAEPFLACYVIKGQSYLALQKLTRFLEAIRENSEIWDALNKSVKTSEMLELNKPPVLKTVINKIFIQ